VAEAIRANWTTHLMMKKRERRHRRRIAVMVAVAASFGSSHSVVTSDAAEKYIDRLHLNKINLRRRHPSELSQPEIRHHRRIESIDSKCRGSSLKPGGILQQNEFLCDGQLRFGIDYRGRFILGFATNDTDTTPDMIAWQAKPTSLFVDDERPFGFIRLAEDGSILGFDALYDEIYDSNYDYKNREQGKEYYSSLFLSNECIVAESVQPGTFCVTLASQAKPGMPNGMTTWGVKVDSDTMISFDPPSSSPTSPQTLQPSQQVTSAFAAEESVAGVWDSVWDSTDSSSVPTMSLTPSPSYSPSITPSTSSLQIGSQSKKTIIYGYVWQDEDRDGKMGREETRIGDFEVKFYECVANGRVSAAGSVRTDVEGLYFIQLPYGEYRALYEVDQDTYGYSAGVQYSNSGWTDCMSSSKTIIVSNVGLYTKDDVSSSEDAPSTEAMIFDDIPSVPQIAEAATEESSAMLGLAKIEPVKLSSIAGFVYMDTNNNKMMDPDERSIAVKGYTVGDGIVKVSLIDCQPANSVLPSVKFVPFPGHYMFGNLTEGSYKLKFELISVDPNATIASMYTFIDGTNQVSASRETQCGKLGQGQDNDQGDVGVQAVQLFPLQGEMEAESASTEFPFVSNMKPGVRTVNEGSGSADVSGIIGGVVVACALIAGVAFFILRKHQPSKFLPLGQVRKDVTESRRNLGLSMDADISTTSDGGSTLVDRYAVGMHAVEEEFDDDDSESSSSSSSSSDSESDDDGDDDDDSRQSSIDYGPVVSNIIAQYSQQQQEEEEQQQNSNMIEAHSQDDHQLQYHGYYNDSSSQHYQQQHYQSQYHHDQYDSASTFSNNSADPPAASYTSLPQQNELVDREGYEVQYEKHLPVQSDSDSESSAEESGGNIIFSSVPPQTSTGSRSRSNPRDDRDSSSWKKEAIPEHSTIVFNSHQIRERTTSPHVDDSKSVISTGSDQSADPPGMSYKDTPFDQFRAPPPRQKANRGRSVPPPPPRKFPSPQQQRYISPQQQRRMSSQQQRFASPQEQRNSTYHPSQDNVEYQR